MKQDGETYRSKSVAAAAERVLSKSLGGPVRLGALEDVWVYPDERRRTIQRAALLEAPTGAPATLIVKRIHGEDPFDPDDVRPLGGSRGDGTVSWRLRNEWAATAFLSGFESDPPLAPRCYGADMAEGFVILEDLGTGERLRELLLGSDPAPAEAALLGYASVLGRLHGVTCGREAEYDRLWESSGHPIVRIRTVEAELLRKNWRRIEAVGDHYGVVWPRGVVDDLERVVAAVGEPGPFAALTQGDNFPANDMYAHGRLRLYDFERAQFRHALFDGFVKPHLLPWRRFRFPEALARRFETIYRSELARGCPAAAADELYARAALEMQAAWLLRLTEDHLRTALERDEHWEGELPEDERATSPTLRQRVLMRLLEFADEAERLGHLEAFGGAARVLAARLAALWGTTPCALRVFPAFARP